MHARVALNDATRAQLSMCLAGLKMLEKEMFSMLKNPAFFMKAKPQYGTVVWNDDIDIAPEHLYTCSTPVEQGLKDGEEA